MMPSDKNSDLTYDSSEFTHNTTRVLKLRRKRKIDQKVEQALSRPQAPLMDNTNVEASMIVDEFFANQLGDIREAEAQK
jgi:hypothetical protein